MCTTVVFNVYTVMYKSKTLFFNIYFINVYFPLFRHENYNKCKKNEKKRKALQQFIIMVLKRMHTIHEFILKHKYTVHLYLNL